MLSDNKSCPFLREGSFCSSGPLAVHRDNNEDSAIYPPDNIPAKKSENNVDTTYRLQSDHDGR